MTESEWLASTEIEQMLEWLDGQVSNRKFLLFACACCRRIWSLLADERSSKAVQMVERHVDHPVQEPEFNTVFWDAQDATGPEEEELRPHMTPEQQAAYYAADAAYSTIPEPLRPEETTRFCAAATAGYAMNASSLGPAKESIAQADLLREIMGNPYRPVSLNTAWLTPTVTSIATAAYEERSLPSGELDPARLAVLADALEEAGCSSDEVLEHLRSPGPHVRGCFALDCLLAKQ